MFKNLSIVEELLLKATKYNNNENVLKLLENQSFENYQLIESVGLYFSKIGNLDIIKQIFNDYIISVNSKNKFGVVSRLEKQQDIFNFLDFSEPDLLNLQSLLNNEEFLKSINTQLNIFKD